MISLERLNQATQPATEAVSLTAVIDSALCVGAGGSSGSLADKPILRNTEGRLVIPASQLKGRLRHECEKLTRALGWPTCRSPRPDTMCPQRVGLSKNFRLDAYRISDRALVSAAPEPSNQDESSEQQLNRRYHCPICQLFGNPTLPARLLFDDLICTETEATTPETLRPGVTINRRRGTAEDQKLYFLETSPANAALRFVGTIHLQADTPDFAQALLIAGLKHIHALGGSKSTGLGWLHWEIGIGAIDPKVWDFLAAGPGGNS